MPSDETVDLEDKGPFPGYDMRRYRIDRWRRWNPKQGRMYDEFTAVNEKNQIVGVFGTYEAAEGFIESVLKPE